MKQFISVFCLLMVAGLLIPKTVFGQYGTVEGKTTGLVLDKKVRSISMDKYFDNISAKSYIFRDGSYIEFQITVENSGGIDLTNVEVKDFLPTDLNLVFYPGKVENNVVTWNIDKLAAGEKKSYTMRAAIKLEQVAINSKRVNKAEAKVNDLSDSDTSIYYVGAAVTPVTGSNLMVYQGLLLISGLLGGLTIRKWSRGY